MKNTVLLSALTLSALSNAGTFTLQPYVNNTTGGFRFIGTPSIATTPGASASISLDPTYYQYVYSAGTYSQAAVNAYVATSATIMSVVEWRFRWEGTLTETPPPGIVRVTLSAYGHAAVSVGCLYMVPGCSGNGVSSLTDIPYWQMQADFGGSYGPSQSGGASAGTKTDQKLGHFVIGGTCGNPGILNGKQICYGYVRANVNVALTATASASSPPNYALTTSEGDLGMKVRIIKIEDQWVNVDH